MNGHYSEADLLETYYTQPGQSMPVMMHLAGCDECASRYARLEMKLRGLAACETDRPESFWTRQRASVMSRLDPRHERRAIPRYARVAAAAVLVLLAAGVTTLWRGTPSKEQPVAVVATAATSGNAAPAGAEAQTVAADPWQSDELKDFQSMVAWESWVDDGSSRPGDQSL